MKLLYLNIKKEIVNILEIIHNRYRLSIQIKIKIKIIIKIYMVGKLKRININNFRKNKIFDFFNIFGLF
jgi:hypothetical protein